MSVKVVAASGSGLKRTKEFIGYDPRTGKTHPTPQETPMEQSGDSEKVGSPEKEEDRQEAKE